MQAFTLTLGFLFIFLASPSLLDFYCCISNYPRLSGFAWHTFIISQSAGQDPDKAYLSSLFRVYLHGNQAVFSFRGMPRKSSLPESARPLAECISFGLHDWRSSFLTSHRWETLMSYHVARSVVGDNMAINFFKDSKSVSVSRLLRWCLTMRHNHGSDLFCCLKAQHIFHLLTWERDYRRCD